ncbi:ER membrane protein DP1/Yop1 [Friedmanniomyces endolithicus]|nr:ER membrane protein DP1/Yop1 [Friedmanniomyces endolithicus]KAK1823318.1 ER membrane protein DP1/Yop1 [Friedmanniomyces endolithicus]
MSQSQGNASGTIQEKAQYHLSSLDVDTPLLCLPIRSSSRHSPITTKLDEQERLPATQTSVPKVYVVLGLAALYFFLVFFNIAGEFLVNTAGFAIPAYYSLEALFSSGKADDSQWLTYWVVYAFLTVIESAVNAVYWFPFYYVFKFVFIIWMALPQTGGAQIVFRSLIQPLFARFFENGSTSTSSNLRNQADKATGKAM